jgi:hypothetical protein
MIGKNIVWFKINMRYEIFFINSKIKYIKSTRINLPIYMSGHETIITQCKVILNNL